MRAQVSGESFQSLSFLAKPFGQVAGIVRAGISHRFQPQALVSDLSRHGLHR